MDTLFSMPSRQINNATFTLGPVLLSSLTNVPTCGGILLRFQIESVVGTPVAAVTYAMENGGVLMGGSTTQYTAPGYYQIGFGRGDFDGTTVITASIQVTGRLRANGIMYSVAQGEDVLEWP